ncbi:helix-turn-helix domain-containing protein [Pandoraea sp. B-6]|uniref:helix-turn-helix domain-containing protein n=1 Tax=Pandoraea sp. B-6 TaxID=1204340 RepID=UPI000379C9E6|nr:helix-turn-helix transcriptional regulator [Pandoraea sp. B-6]
MAEHDSGELLQKKVAARRFIAEEILRAAPPDSLAKLRLSRGLSQQELARLTCTSQSHIAKIEAGSVKMFLDTAIKLADALGVSLDRFRELIRNEKIAAQVSAI